MDVIISTPFNNFLYHFQQNLISIYLFSCCFLEEKFHLKTSEIYLFFEFHILLFSTKD
jgi:hypothetical protein